MPQPLSADHTDTSPNSRILQQSRIDRRTVKKMLSYSAPPGYRRTKPVRRPKLDGFTGIVDAILGGGHGSGGAAQAASHGAPDLRAAAGRARVHRRLYHREGLCPGPAAIDARGFCAAASPAGPCPGRLRRGGGGAAGAAGEDCLLLPDPAPFQCLVREGLSEGRRPRPSWTAMSAPSPFSAGCHARSSMTTRPWRWHGSWATARVGARRPSPTCNRIICSATASAGPARATTRARSRPW